MAETSLEVQNAFENEHQDNSRLNSEFHVLRRVAFLKIFLNQLKETFERFIKSCTDILSTPH